MSEENIHVDTLVTEDMKKDELYDYAKYLEYRKEELLNINHSLQQKVEQLEKEVNEYQKELEKADSITQSCIFQGKQESKISFRNCLNRLEQLENIRKEAIEYIDEHIKYECDNAFNGMQFFSYHLYDFDKQTLLNILNKGDNKE